ncbi:MAG TPA: phosphoglycerate kinase [Solirubrobacteraceae bacterium]|nr:phosphoglycerate kinase [Solirubrobacteraceae bacterium]
MRSIDELDVRGQRVLVRVDFNVPLGEGPDGRRMVTDDTRIRAALPTIEELRARGARLVLASHLGRPKGKVVPELSLEPVVSTLCQLTGAPVSLAPAVVGPAVRELTEQLAEGEILVLENVRFEPGETANDPELAHALAELADLYVDDAFGTAHRAHASTEGVAHLLPAAAGRLLEKEVKTLTGVLDHPAPPLIAILGGAKVADKIAVIDRFLGLADALLIGGAMCFPFLAAQGHAVGASLCEDEDVDHARHALARAADCAPRGDGLAADRRTALPDDGTKATRLCLPKDLVIGESFAEDAPNRILSSVEVPSGWMGLDIGPATCELYAREIAAAGSVFWNGPMGAFELTPFAAGTQAVAKAVAEAPGLTVVGGGDSAAALVQFGLEDAVDYLSTGGGATLELVEGRVLPGLRALDGAGVA